LILDARERIFGKRRPPSQRRQWSAAAGALFRPAGRRRFLLGGSGPSDRDLAAEIRRYRFLGKFIKETLSYSAFNPQSMALPQFTFSRF